MRITSLELKNLGPFGLLPKLDFGDINIFVGPNNSGKSTLLKAVGSLQKGIPITASDIRIQEQTWEIVTGILSESGDEIRFEGDEPIGRRRLSNGKYQITGPTPNKQNPIFRNPFSANNGNSPNMPVFGAVEPAHAIVPFLAAKKHSGFDEDILEPSVKAVGAGSNKIPAKFLRMSERDFEPGDDFFEFLEAVLGFRMSAIPSQNGRQVGIRISEQDKILINAMGTGVPIIVALALDLAVYRRKVYVIEELENDLHPEALKALLGLMVEKSATNQIFISTHSHIVLKYLGSQPNSKVFRVFPEQGADIPTSTVTEVKTLEGRTEVLTELGYDLADFDLNEGWLILEEASAERIVRDYLIPWFAPKLTRIRTVSTRGIDRVAPFFEDLRRLVLYMHLEDRYREKCWVRVDGDGIGQDTIEKLRESYRDWPDEQFSTFSEEQFEKYYPARFQPQVEAVLAMTDKAERRAAKKALLLEVVAWLDANPDEGKEALAESAAEVIEHLQKIEETF